MTIDRSSWWWQRGRAVLAVGLGLLLTGWATTPLEQTAWGAVRARQPELNLHDFKSAVGQGMVLGVLGGFRSIMADFSWISAFYSWETQNPKMAAQTEALVYLTVLLDPRSTYFWSNGSRMIGLDIPSWYARGGRTVTPEQKAEIEGERQRAQQLLDRGLTFHPQSWNLHRDKAMMYQYNMHNLPAAAEQYRLAAEGPGAPYYLARIYAETLRQLGRYREAYDYLLKLYPTLPAKVPAAAKDAVWEQLRDLEDQLKLPPSERLPAADEPPGYKTAESAPGAPASAH
jgi:hypothetical protein